MEKPKKRRGGWIALLVLVVLLALICAAPFAYNALSHFAYDDLAALAAESGEALSVTADADGEHLLFSADKADVCALLLELDAPERVRAATNGRATLERVGYTLTPERAEIRMAVKLFGLIPAQLQANAAVEQRGDAVRARLTDVQIGPWIRLTAEKAARLTGFAPLAEEYEFSLADYTGPLRADRVWIENDGIAFSSPLLAQVIDRAAAQPDDTVRLLRLYEGDGGDGAMGAVFGGNRAAFIRESGASVEALRRALAEVAALGTDADRRALQAELSALPIDLTSELEHADEARAARLGRIAQAQKLYADEQLGLRNVYWHKEVRLKDGRLLRADGTQLEAALPAAWEARVVLQYNENYDAIVKTNEGNPRLLEPIPGLPRMSELPRDSRASLPAEGDGPFDLTLALRLPSGVPVIVFLTAEDEFGLAVIPEALFAEIGESTRTPVLSSAAVCTQPRDQWLRLTGLGEDIPAGNYIGLE